VAPIAESRRTRAPLAAISLFAAAPMLYMAVNQRLDYDSWWHVFIAREAPWAHFWRDVYINAHPPVFYLLLRAAAEFGSHRLVYRSLSIVAAVVATYVIGRIATRVFRTPILSLPCALAFGLAMTTVTVACAVRSYMLAVALLLIAFRAYLDLVDPRHGPIATKTRVVFAAALIGAITTHYSAIFFFCAAATVPCLYSAVDGRYRMWWRERLRTRWTAEIATLIPIAAVVVAVYFAHLFQFRDPMPHVLRFFPDRSEAAAGLLAGSGSFFARSMVAEIDLFSPVPIAGLRPTTDAVVLSLFAIIAIGLVLTLHRRSDWVVALTPIATLAILATAMMGASLLGRYPFGGALHHQFILFPFIVLSIFALVDEIVARSHHEWVALAAVSAAVILNGVVQWRLVQLVDDEPAARELATFDRYFGDSRAVYVDQTNLIYFFAGHHRSMWLAQSGLGAKFDALPVIDPQRTLLVLRDTKRWNSDLADRELYGDLRQVIALTQVPSVDLFWLSRDEQLPSPPSRLERVQLAESFVGLADREGLRVERLVLDGSHLYGRLRLDGDDTRMREAGEGR
jgi:hypothetical protein